LLPCTQGITSRRFDLLQQRMRVTTGRTDQVERLAHFRCLTDASQSELPGDVGLDHGRHADYAEAELREHLHQRAVIAACHDARRQQPRGKQLRYAVGDAEAQRQAARLGAASHHAAQFGAQCEDRLCIVARHLVEGVQVLQVDASQGSCVYQVFSISRIQIFSFSLVLVLRRIALQHQPELPP